jgi:hypothetical protein
MPSRHLGRCDGHHEMVDCIGLALGVFNGLAPGVFNPHRELEIERK